MKTKPILIRFLSFLILLGAVALYLWLYLFPTMAAINRERRETVDIGTAIEDIRRERINFTFLGEREEEMLEKMTQNLHAAIPRIRGKADWRQNVDKIKNYIERLAQSHHIDLIELTEAGKEASAAPGSLKHRTLAVTFSSDPMKGLNFINRLPRGEQLLCPRALTVTPGEGNPHFKLELRVYYVTGKKALARIELPGPRVDRDSGILLDSVFETSPYRFSQQELGRRLGSGMPKKR